MRDRAEQKAREYITTILHSDELHNVTEALDGDVIALARLLCATRQAALRQIAHETERQQRLDVPVKGWST
jgi:hypothetical protein